MKHKSILLFSALILCFWIPPEARAEKLSFRLSYMTNSIENGDIFSWIDSYNLLWNDWRNRQGGTLEGQFVPPNYTSGYEIELRIPIFEGFALTLGGTQLKSQTEGSIQFENSSLDQRETHFVSNRITALPFKFGASYRFKFPFLSSLSACVGAGRLIVFAEYESSENYTLESEFLGTEYNYWYEISGDYRSECMGFYANLTVEFEFVKFAAIVVGMEQKWAKMDGFKGDYVYKDYKGDQDIENGRASLYFYESKEWGLGVSYSVLAGHVDKPQDENIENLRQGRLNFGSYSFTIGIRFII